MPKYRLRGKCVRYMRNRGRGFTVKGSMREAVIMSHAMCRRCVRARDAVIFGIASPGCEKYKKIIEAGLYVMKFFIEETWRAMMASSYHRNNARMLPGMKALSALAWLSRPL